MCVIVDETTLEELFTRLSAVERENARIARQLAVLYVQHSSHNGYGEGNVLPPDQLSSVQEAVPGLSNTSNEEQAYRLAKLTVREMQVLRLVAQGFSDAEVGTRLVITRRTVNSYLTSIYSKLSVSSRTAAARYMFEQQFL